MAGEEMNRKQVYRSKYLAGQVIRYHTWPTLRNQNVAEHCWHVATIYVEMFGMPRAEVLYFCLHHDSGEMWAGDIPFTGKDRIPGLRQAINASEAQGLEVLGITLPELSEEERRRCKICDLLEMHQFGMQEYRMGNKLALPIAEDTLNAAYAVATGSERDLISKWRTNNV